MKDKRVMAIALCICMVLGVGFDGKIVCEKANAESSLKVQELDGKDAKMTLSNPERGFYVPTFLPLSQENNHAANPKDSLVHLRLDLAAFSDNARIATDTYGTSQELNENALEALSDTFENIRKAGNTVIVRSCYDHYFDGNSNCEPSQELILTHLKQLAKVYTKYKDVIAYIELGTYGPWGEMHTSKCCTKENVVEALNTMLANTPKELSIGVRTPGYVAAWLGISESDFYIGGSAYEAAMNAKGLDATRVGMFNDGYLGSYSDLGTFGTITREKGTEWLSHAAKTTLYGGEVVRDSSGSVLGDYNQISYLATEAFQTHTSYLNSQWNNEVIAAWKNQTYEKQGDEYDGESAFKYVSDHLGYRLVLRKSEMSDPVNDRVLHLRLSIDNVGFGNIVKKKVASIVLQNEKKAYYEFPLVSCDPTTLWSGQNNVVEGEISLPEKLADGEYLVYLRFSQYGDLQIDKNSNCVKFANVDKYWNETIGANYIGKFVNSYQEPVITPEPLNTPGPKNNQSEETVKVGQIYQIGGLKYQVLKSTRTVAFVGSTKKKGTIKVKDSVKIAGKTYQVTKVSKSALKGYKKIQKVILGTQITSIEKNAFYGCKSLKRIEIKSKKLKRVGKNAIRGIASRATIKVPAKKRTAYKQLLKSNTGYRKTMKIK